MIVIFSQLAESCVRNRVWLVSLGLAAAINLALIWLAGLATPGRLAALQRPSAGRPFEIVMRRIAPPPPALDALGLSESPPAALPPRFRPRSPSRQALPDLRLDGAIPPAQVRLNLNPCPLDDPDSLRRPGCTPSPDWLRADRDVSDLLGSNAQGYTLDEIAAARGWIKAKPRTGQDAMAAATDATLPETIFKDAPFPPPAIERSGGW